MPHLATCCKNLDRCPTGSRSPPHHKYHFEPAIVPAACSPGHGRDQVRCRHDGVVMTGAMMGGWGPQVSGQRSDQRVNIREQGWWQVGARAAQVRDGGW